MALTFPYTYISCPCSDASKRLLTSKRSSREIDYDKEIEEDEKTFDPRNPRSAFSLFPPEHLLYCEECHEIKCPRCITEEIVTHYCPSCLFESPSSMVRGEGNRCPRNCFQCPVCTSQLITASIGDGREGPFILNCNYCMWSTLDIGIKFDKPTSIRAQLDKLANGGQPKPPANRALHGSSSWEDPARKSSLSKPPVSAGDDKDGSDASEESEPPAPTDPTARFEALKAFYKEQSLIPDFNVNASNLDMYNSSPSSLARIMSIYTNPASLAKKQRQKPTTMREALTPAEGLLLVAPTSAQSTPPPPPPPPPPYDQTTTPNQLLHQYPPSIGTPGASAVSALRPMPTLLRTKRSKRCATCRHILVKPEFKISSVRHRIKLIALSYIPFVTLRPLPVPGGLPPPGPDGTDALLLRPGVAVQFVLTLRNPLFDDVGVSLGTPAVTPGRLAHKVTILCPQFTIGKNSDAWEDALGAQQTLNAGMVHNVPGEQIAGKLYDQGRNWVSVVIEIVPAGVARGPREPLGADGDEDDEDDEDVDVVEVPVRVRLGWKVSEEEGGGGGGGGGGDSRRKAEDEDDGKRELSYWMVLGVGRVVR